MRDPSYEPPPLPPLWDERPREEAGAVPWRAREAFVIALLALGAGIFTSIVTSLFFEGDALVAVGILASELVLGFAVVTWLRVHHRVGPAALGLRWRGRRDVLLGIGAGVLGLGLSYLVVTPIVVGIAESISGGPIEAPEQIDFDRPDAAVLALTGAAVVLAAPVAEEMFFRGFLYRGLRRRHGAGGAAVISSGVFAVTHVIPLIMPAIFVLGLVLARVVERTGSLVPAVVAHVMFNAVGFAFVLAFTL